MRYRTFHISRSTADGFKLHLTERSVFRDAVESVADWLCAATGHHGCNSWYGKVAEWAEGRETRLTEIPTTREVADAVAYDKETWSWLDEDES